MAAGDSNLSLEFECAICSDQLKQPKFIGPCNHTFCKDCIHQLWVSHGSITIPCPQCRQECQIPPNDVDGLKDNFLVARIIETYRKEHERNANRVEVRCTLCPNRASSFCKKCDLMLCPECKGRRYSKACDHDLYGLCPTHGKGLLFFCTPCKLAICSGCRMSGHDEGNHNITPVCSVVEGLVSKIKSSSTELEVAKTQVGEQEKQLSWLRNVVLEKSTSAEVQATAGAEKTIADKRNVLGGLKAKSQTIQDQIDRLLKEKENVDDWTQQLVGEIDEFEEEKRKTIADVKKKHTEVVEDMTQRLRFLDTRRKKMTTKLEQGHALGTAEITIDNESIANLTSISQELADLVRASGESDAVIEEVMRSIGELGPRVDDTRQDNQMAVIRREEKMRLIKKKGTILKQLFG